MAKKKKKQRAKKTARMKEKARQRRKRRRARSSEGTQGNILHIGGRPSMSSMEPPEGFRTIGMAQSTFLYGQPIIELAEKKGVGIEEAMNISMLLWNHALLVERQGDDPSVREPIVSSLGVLFGLASGEAEAFLDEMLERKAYLFPDEIQPDDPFFMYVRKEERQHIRRFDYEGIGLSDEVAGPGEEDERLVERLRELDDHIREGADYGEYEALYFSVEEESEERFGQWLRDKGATGEASEFAGCLSIFFGFVYGYMHDDPVMLHTISQRYFREFFDDYLLRKMTCGPNEYAWWPPALRLFYTFLHEKGYLEDEKPFHEIIRRLEPGFIDNLNRQFG